MDAERVEESVERLAEKTVAPVEPIKVELGVLRFANLALVQNGLTAKARKLLDVAFALLQGSGLI